MDQATGTSGRAAAGRRSEALGWLLGLAGAAGGAAVGFWLFVVIASQGFYAIILPGTLLGLGGGALTRRRRTALGILCGLAGLAVGVLAEWYVFPFRADRSLGYFLAHLHELHGYTQAMIVLGGLLAFWFGRGREQVLPLPPAPAGQEGDEAGRAG